ncbi:MAG: hypothetical protein GX684_01255 [Ruminococcaceae bacterium]|nr:hypothetical protein [Oscillospiraceae bacterium]
MRAIAQSRDQKLLDGIIKHKYLRTDQAAEIYFSNIKDKHQRRQKASTRLLRLYQKHLVQRFQFPGEPFIYTCSGTKYSPKIHHYMAINDVLIQFLSLVPNGSRLEYEIEHPLGENIIADLFMHYTNEFRGTQRNLCIEVELENTADIQAKITKYEEYADDHPDIELIVICKHKRTIDRIKSRAYDLPVQAIDMRFIREQFKF